MRQKRRKACVLVCKSREGTMGNQMAGSEKRGTPTERLEQAQERGGDSREEEKAQQRKRHTQNEESRSIALSESNAELTSPSSQILSPRCHPCHAQPLDNSLPDGLPTLLQLVQEKDKYKILYEEAEKRNRCLTNENDTHRHIIGQKDNEILGLHNHLLNLQRNYRQHIYDLNEKLKEREENCRDLSLKIERAEHLHSRQSMADSGSYQDSAATPPLLQLAVDSVKDAITVYASELFSRIKKNSLPINFVGMNLDSKDTGQTIKVALQSFLCHALFRGFEDPFFSASDGLPPFVNPASRKAHLLQVYKRCRDLDARQMLNEETEFVHFFGVKESQLCMQLKEQLITTEYVQKTEKFITSELCSRNNNYYSKLLRLVKAVWVLHKLAFAFEPSAEIFQVGQGSVLDEEFMEDVARDDDEDDHEDEIMAESFRTVKEVRFMCVPGFIVRHTIIKSRVFCLGRSKRSRTEDSSPMTVD